MTLTDEEIRVKVAEIEDLGSQAFLDEWKENHDSSHVDYFTYFRIPDYLNDPGSALQLCERMRREGWIVKIVYHWQYDNVFVEAWKMSSLESKPVRTEDHSLARAVTLCFLKIYENRNSTNH